MDKKNYSESNSYIKSLESVDTKNLIPLLKKICTELSPNELKNVLTNKLKEKITSIESHFTIQPILVPGLSESRVTSLINSASKIFAPYNIKIITKPFEIIPQNQLEQNGLDEKGNFHLPTRDQIYYKIQKKYAKKGIVPVLFVNKLTGDALSYTTHGGTLGKKNPLIFIRKKTIGQTLAHELGHVLGGSLGKHNHGHHVDAITKTNLMNSDPIIGRFYTSLNLEQIVAFKSSPFMTQSIKNRSSLNINL
jgi:hypothetical protein